MKIFRDDHFRYDSGSYDTMASTEYWNECTVCGAKSEPWRKSHGYYG